MPSWKSLDDLIRPQQQRRRDREAEGLRGLEVDHQLELRRRLDREIARAGTLRGLEIDHELVPQHERLVASILGPWWPEDKPSHKETVGTGSIRSRYWVKLRARRGTRE